MKTLGDQCVVCPYRFDLCAKLERAPFYREFRIAKTYMPELPRCFEETLLGEPKGGIRQYRGPLGTHVHEYNDVWIFHRDKIDPRHNALGHLINDAPHVLILGASVASLLLSLVFPSEEEKGDN